MSSFLQAEGLCLRYPDKLGQHATINYESAANMLLRAITLSQQVPFVWGFIDKPAEGTIFLLFLTAHTSFPVDGIRWQEPESRYMIPVGGGRELEVCEVKYGFIPNSQDNAAWRARRRYRLHKGGHPQLVLVHYYRVQYAPIYPNLANQPVRSYPLRQVNEPAIYVMGDKMGQKVYTHGGAPPGSAMSQGPAPPPPPPPPGMHPNAAGGGMAPLPMNMHTQQAMLAQQNSTMEALERRRERERARERGPNITGVRAQPPRVEDDDSADEMDHISTRTLALTRYKRNHELMNDVFRHAAFGDKKELGHQSPYTMFNLTELEEKVVKLSADIEEIKQQTSERTKARVTDVGPSELQSLASADISMMDMTLSDGIAV